MPIIIFAAVIIAGVTLMLVFRARSRAADRRKQEENAAR